MKNSFLRSAILVLLLFPSVVLAQLNCSKYYQLKEGTGYEMKMYDKKDKLTGTVKYQVKESTSDKGTIVSSLYDNKGKEIFNSEYDIFCKGDGITIDFKSLMNADFMKQYKEMEVDMTGTNLDIPNNLQVGQSLPDASMQAIVNLTPIKMKMNIKMIDRKVERKESITTSAGTFDCIVISYVTEFKMGMKRTGRSKQWLAEGVGLVKTEEYNKKGKLQSYTVLSSIN